MNYVVWDIETDSAQLDWATMIEVGAILLDAQCFEATRASTRGIRSGFGEATSRHRGFEVALEQPFQAPCGFEVASQQPFRAHGGFKNWKSGNVEIWNLDI